MSAGRVVHEVASAVNEPKTDKVYGAYVETFRLRRGKVVIRWRIFSRKTRKKTPASK